MTVGDSLSGKCRTIAGGTVYFGTDDEHLYAIS